MSEMNGSLMKERENLMNEYIREWKNGEYV
jgi:hypothetical protein